MPSIFNRETRSFEKNFTNAGAAGSREGSARSRSSPNIFIFWSPAIGEKHGYYDEFRSDGCFYYTGAGQYGDQRMRDANLALLNYREEGRRVHLFEGAGGLVQ